MLDTFDFTNIGTFVITYSLLFLIIFSRYILLSSAYHYIFLVLFRRYLKSRILFDKPPASKQLKREILLSLYSALIFSTVGMFILLLRQMGFTRIYSDPSELTFLYVPLSVLLFLIMHDTYYYWLHLWMHSSKWMRRFHSEHHKSVDTNVFTSFSFHPVESFLQSLILPVIFIMVPMSLLAIVVTLSIMTLSAIVNHAGIEIYGINGKSAFLAKYIIGATHHDIHHRNSKKNLGLYFTFWDRIMKTESSA